MPIVPRVLLIIGMSVVGLAVVGAILYLALPESRSALDGALNGTLNGALERPATAARSATAAPVVSAATPVGPGVSGLADPKWVADTAKSTGIPARALRSYSGVAIEIARANPSCGIGWNTLAAIGEVESRHGTIFGGAITANGNAVPAIFGVALDGVSTARVPDSDGGAIDGDPKGDRAVGPMQLIPEAWRNWHTDAGGDGVEDPQNLDDAAMAAGHYLCRAGGELSTEQGWRRAVLAYNNSDRYLNDVIRYATGYASDAK